MEHAAKSTLKKIVGLDHVNTVWSAMKPFVRGKKYHKGLIKGLKKIFKFWEEPRLVETATGNAVKAYNFDATEGLNVNRYIRMCKRGLRKVIKYEHTVALIVILELKKKFTQAQVITNRQTVSTTKTKKTMAIVNVNNIDDKCFIYAILSALHPQERNPQRQTKYKNDFNKSNSQ